MRFILLELIAIFRDIGRALLDGALRRADRRYEHSVHVRAPRNIVWGVATARTITFDGSPPIVLTALPSPQPGIELLQVRTGALTYRLGLREVERREGIGEIHAVVPEHTDHLPLSTGMSMTGFTLLDAPGGTHLTMFQEGRGGRFGARINTPMGLRLMGRRIAAASEQTAGLRLPKRMRAQPEPQASGR